MITVEYTVRVTMGKKVVLQNWGAPPKGVSLCSSDAHPAYSMAVARATKGSKNSGSHCYNQWVEFATFDSLQQAMACELALQKIKKGELP